MDNTAQIFSDKIWWMAFGTFIFLVGLLTMSLIFPSANTRACIKQNRTSSSIIYYESNINAVTNALAGAVNFTATGLSSSIAVADCGGKAMASTASRGLNNIAAAVVSSASFVLQSIGTATLFTARALGVALAFMFYLPSSILGAVSDTPLVSAAIKPQNLAVSPVIGSISTDEAAHVSLAAAKTTADTESKVDSTPSWPIHGVITTEFGVPELPYQPIHTGLDISDGARPGVTPVHPFKPGRIIDVVHSSSGLGNHVVIDHGGGLTSVYGHLYSTSVTVGQIVDKTTVLGLEGSTGVSTGTHLHFEVKVNGQFVDPRRFITAPL
jgi:murein DD-endopeptidase MepM/ murein hydrolase activator NlpD